MDRGVWSSVHGIFQARVLAIIDYNESESHVRLSATPETVTCQVPLSTEFSMALLGLSCGMWNLVP